MIDPKFFNFEPLESIKINDILTPDLEMDPESESLENQLDRLNYNLLELLKNNEKDLYESFSNNLTETIIDTEDELNCRSENLIHKYDSCMMTAEDYRSHELRNNAESLKSFKASVNLSQLYGLRQEIDKAIKSVESSLCNSFKVHIGDTEFILNILNTSLLTTKENIVNGFAESNKSYVCSEPYIKQLENELEELHYKLFHQNPAFELEKNMFEAYSENFSSEDCFQSYTIDSIPTLFLLKAHLRNMKQISGNCKDFIDELQWESLQISLFKSNYEQKIKNLEEREVNVAKYVKETHFIIKQKIETFENIRTTLKNEKEKIFNAQNRIKDEFNLVRNEINAIKSGILKNKLAINTNLCVNYAFNKPNYTTFSEIEVIENNIKDLEHELNTTSDKNAVIFKINHLRNRLSTLKSEKVLNSRANIKKSSFISPRNSSISDPKALSAFLDIKKGFQSTSGTPRVNTRANSYFKGQEFTFENLPEPPKFEYPQIMDAEKNENLNKFLELKESRLRKKEQEIIKMELNLQKTWMKLPNANELIPFIQNEILAVRARTENLEKTQVQLENLIKENLEMQHKLKAEDLRSKDIVLKINEKAKIAEKLEELCLKIEKIIVEESNYILNSTI